MPAQRVPFDEELKLIMECRYCDDWEGKFNYLKDYCEVVYMPRTPEISTTQIKEELKK